MLNLKKINPSYLYSFGEVQDLLLEREGLCLINGENKDDTGSNNDVGKSNLLKSVSRLLYDEDRSSTSINAVPNKVLKKGCAACITFEVGEISYRVILIRGWRSKRVPFDVEDSEIINVGDFYKGSDVYLEILENGVWRDIRDASSSKTKVKLQRILGLTFEQFEASSYMAQNSNFLALSGKPSDKFALVQPFLDFDVWDEAQSKIEVLCNDLNLKIQEIENKIQIAEASYQNLDDQEELYTSFEEICKEIAELEKERDKDLSEVEKKLDALKAREEETYFLLLDQQTSKFVFQRQEKLDKFQSEKKELEEYYKKKEDKAKSDRDNSNFLSNEMKAQIAVADAEIKRLKAEISKTENLGATCETCGQDIKNKELTLCNLNQSLENQIAIKLEIEERLQAFTDSVEKSYKDKIRIIEDNLTTQSDKLQCQIDYLLELRISQEKVHDNTIKQMSTMYSMRLKSLKQEIKDLQEDLNLKAVTQAKIDSAEIRKRDIVNRRMQIAAKIQKYQNDIAQLQVELENLVTEKSQYNLLEKHLGIKGIRNFETMTILTELSDYASEYLSRLSGGMVNISISPYKESKDTSALFSGVSKISEVVKDSFKEGVPASLSGGAVYRQMSIAIMFALRAIAQARGLGTNVLFLDEVDRDMSDLNVDRLVQFFSEFKTVCPSIFIISHNDRFKNTIHPDKEILVSRENGISRIFA